MALNKVSDFKTRLRDAMRIRGLTAVQVSNGTGLSQSLISNYLAGRFQAKSDKLRTLALYLNVSEAWLMGLDVPRRRMFSNPIMEDVYLSTRAQKEKTIHLDVHEAEIVRALRKQPEMQAAIDRLLGVEVKSPVTPETVQAVVTELGDKPKVFKIKTRIVKRKK